MAELERIYKDTDTGGWGWVTQEATGDGGEAVRMLQFNLNLNTSISSFSSGPELFFPVIADPTIGPVIPSIPTKVNAGQHVAYVSFTAPDDDGDPIVLDYVELAVANLDYTEALSVYSEANISVPAGTTKVVSLAELSGANPQIGTDLSLFDLGGAGAIKSDAGGVFFAQVALDIQVA